MSSSRGFNDDVRLDQCRAIVDGSADAIALLSSDGSIQCVTPAIKRLSGYAPQELIGTSAFDLIHPDDRAAVRDAFRCGMEAPGVPVRVEYRSRHRDGSWRRTEVVGVNRLAVPSIAAFVVNYRDTTARHSDFISIIEDITERNRAEGELRQAHKMEAVGRLAGGIAHDFNNLLTAIVGYAELVLGQLPIDSVLRNDVEEIRRAGHSAGSLTRQLLAFSRKQVLTPQILDLNASVTHVSKLLHRLIGEHIRLESRLSTPLDRVLADAGQIEQVILNLALNARDAMATGGTLSIETANIELDHSYVVNHPGAHPGPHVMLAISDTGGGMDQAVQQHVFEPFYSTKAPGQGTGLGLATVYGIVKQSDGSIFVHSEPGHGTTFKVFLPRVEPMADVPQMPANVPRAFAGTETVLLVEDQPEVRSAAREMLRRHGYTVIDAANGSEALIAARNHQGPIDLLVTDVVMPDLGGRALAAQFLQQQPAARVLYMSGYTDDTIVQQGILDGGAAFIQKPFTPAALLQKVRDVLDGGL